MRAELPGKRYVHLAAHGLVDQQYGALFSALAVTAPPTETTVAEDDGFLLGAVYSDGKAVKRRPSRWKIASPKLETCRPPAGLCAIYWGYETDEVSLSMLCGTTVFGTSGIQIANAVERLGFEYAYPVECKYSLLNQSLKDAVPPIVAVNAAILYPEKVFQHTKHDKDLNLVYATPREDMVLAVEEQLRRRLHLVFAEVEELKAKGIDVLTV